MDELLSLLNKSGFRQNYLAEKFNITPEYLSLILNGKRKAKRLKERLIQFLQTNEFETQKINIDINSIHVGENNNGKDLYEVKDKIIIQQAEEIFKLKQDINDATEQANKLEQRLKDLERRMKEESKLKKRNGVKNMN